MPKRKAQDEGTQSQLARVLNVRGASERAAHTIWNICHEDDDKSLSRHKWTDAVAEELSPWRDVTTPVSFDCCDGSAVVLPIVDLKLALAKVCSKSSAYTAALKRAFSTEKMLQPIIYCDEATAGNVLAVNKSRKANLFHISWMQCWHHLKNPSMWLPLAVVQTSCLQSIRGGTSKVIREILHRCVNQAMEEGFWLCDTIYFRQSQKAYFLGDHDAVRQVFNFKGSSGLKPCSLCANVVKPRSGIVEIDPFFVEISASDGFKPMTDAQLWSDFDTLRSCRNKAELQRQEKCTGLSFNEAALMFDKLERVKLPPSWCIYDYMHTYLCNGVASWEIAYFLQMVFDHTSLTLSDLQRAVQEDAWQSLRSSRRTKTYLSNLFHDRLLGDGLYKGEAHQTTTVLSLILFYVQTVIEPAKQVPAKYIQSFYSLCRITAYVRNLKHSTNRVTAEAMDELNRLQKIHHETFLAYEVDHKPKHHHRFHLPAQWLKCGVVISCEALEAKHQLYKSGVAHHQDGNAQDCELFSHAVLPRLLRMSAKEDSLPFWTLMHPIEASLQDKIFFATTKLTTSKCCLAGLLTNVPFSSKETPEGFVRILSLVSCVSALDKL